MKKILLFSIALGLAGFLLSAPAQAQTSKDFFISADVPEATSVSFVVSDVDPASNQFYTHTTGTSLNFALSPNPTLGIYTVSRIFAIDVATSGGAGNPDLDILYTDTNNPNSGVGGNGLTHKGVATIQKVAGPTGDQTVTDIATARLGLISRSLDSTVFAGGFGRILIGIATGNTDPAKGSVDPAGAEPFTNADQPGLYQGTLRLTATLPG